MAIADPTSWSSPPSTNLPVQARTFTVDNLGCAKNQVDAETMIAALEDAGWRYVVEPERAELIVVNTCGFIASAKEESIDAALSMRARFPGKRILLAGCLAQRYASVLSNELPEVDGIFGNRAPERIVEIVERVMAGERIVRVPTGAADVEPARPAAAVQPAPAAPAAPLPSDAAPLPSDAAPLPSDAAPLPSDAAPPDPQGAATAPPAPQGAATAPPAPQAAVLIPPTAAAERPGPQQPFRRRLLSFSGSVYVKIAEGCSNRCTYCAIPLIRGDLASRPIAEVVEEIDRFARGGAKEFILVAQDSASYGRERGEGGLRALLERITAIRGDFWVRLLYFHPDRFDAGVLPFFRSDPRLLPYFDLPFQHASRAVLRRMGRTGDAAHYLGLIRGIRAELPEAVLRSTFLVGFPGEGSEEFEELLAFQRSARLDWAGVFPYSREEGTAAYRMRVPAEKRASRREALARARRLEEQQIPITERRLERFVGRQMSVLIEERIEGTELYLGRGYAHAPEVDGSVVVDGAGAPLGPGVRVECRVTRRNGIDLEAAPLELTPRRGSS